jgi:hypothetical protein
LRLTDPEIFNGGAEYRRRPDFVDPFCRLFLATFFLAATSFFGAAFNFYGGLPLRRGLWEVMAAYGGGGYGFYVIRPSMVYVSSKGMVSSPRTCGCQQFVPETSVRHGTILLHPSSFMKINNYFKIKK